MFSFQNLASFSRNFFVVFTSWSKSKISPADWYFGQIYSTFSPLFGSLEKNLEWSYNKSNICLKEMLELNDVVATGWTGFVSPTQPISWCSDHIFYVVLFHELGNSLALLLCLTIKRRTFGSVLRFIATLWRSGRSILHVYTWFSIWCWINKATHTWQKKNKKMLLFVSLSPLYYDTNHG